MENWGEEMDGRGLVAPTGQDLLLHPATSAIIVARDEMSDMKTLTGRRKRSRTLYPVLEVKGQKHTRNDEATRFRLFKKLALLFQALALHHRYQGLHPILVKLGAQKHIPTTWRLRNGAVGNIHLTALSPLRPLPLPCLYLLRPVLPPMAT